MGLPAKHFRLWNWIAIVAMLFSALAPALSHAVPGDRSSDAQLTAICTSTGTKFVKVDAAADPGSSRPAVSAPADCPFCLLGGHVPAPPGQASNVLPAVDTADAPTAIRTALWVSAWAWLPAQPRAPPLSR